MFGGYLTSKMLNENLILLYDSTGGFGNRSRLHSSLTKKETNHRDHLKLFAFPAKNFFGLWRFRLNIYGMPLRRENETLWGVENE
jgi:hypothetical protein